MTEEIAHQLMNVLLWSRRYSVQAAKLGVSQHADLQKYDRHSLVASSSAKHPYQQEFE